eukprot:3199378-Amphidinium_carterae.1
MFACELPNSVCGCMHIRFVGGQRTSAIALGSLQPHKEAFNASASPCAGAVEVRSHSVQTEAMCQAQPSAPRYYRALRLSSPIHDVSAS